MGRNAIVKTRHCNDTYEVPITAEWLDATHWEPLPINEPTEAKEELDEPGTTILVSDLNEGVARHLRQSRLRERSDYGDLATLYDVSPVGIQDRT